MKKILLGLFVLSSLSFADAVNNANKSIHLNVSATITGNLSLVITDQNGEGNMNELSFPHNELASSFTKDSVVENKFKILVTDGRASQVITNENDITFEYNKNLEISNGISTIPTNFSNITFSNEVFSITNTIPAPIGSSYGVGNYSGQNNLSIIYHKTTTPTPGQ